MGVEHLFEEIIGENIPNLEKQGDMHAQEAQRSASKINSRWPTPRHIKIKMLKIKYR